MKKFGFRHLIAALFLFLPLFAQQKTTVTGTFYFRDGTTPFNGIVRVVNGRFTTADGFQIIPRTQSYTVTNGTFSIDLEPTDSATPMDSKYTVSFESSVGFAQLPRTWWVPISSSSVTEAMVLLKPGTGRILTTIAQPNGSSASATTLLGGTAGQYLVQTAPNQTGFKTPNAAGGPVTLDINGNASIGDPSAAVDPPAGSINIKGNIYQNGTLFSPGSSDYPGLTSDGANGLAVAGAASFGAGTPTILDIVCVNIVSLPVSGIPVGRHMQVCDGATASDSTLGGGSNKHWVYWTGSAWVSEDPTGPQGQTGPIGQTGPAGPAGAAVTAPVALSTTCAGTVNWAVGSVGIAGASITTTGSCNLTMSGMLAGGFYTVAVTQGSGGSHTLTLGTGGTGGCAAWKVGGSGSGAVTPTTTAGAIDVLAIYYDGTNCFANYRGNFN